MASFTPFNPFSVYRLQVDEESEEVFIQAWDEEAPQDRFYCRLPLEDVVKFIEDLDLHRA